jgi:hypothetical protein
MLRTYKTAGHAASDAERVTVRFDSKIAILLRDDLVGWERLNVTAFLASAIAGADPGLIGKDYADGDGTAYLAMFRQPVLVFQGDAATLRSAHARALERHIPLAIYTEELFSTGNDEDNRAAVAAVGRDKLRLVGIGLHGPRNAVDKLLKGAQLHP